MPGLQNAVRREDAGETAEGVDDAAATDDASGIEDAVAANLGVVADDGTEFSQAGADGFVLGLDGDGLPIQSNVGEDHARTEVGFVAEDGVADVVEMGDFAAVEDDAVLELAGIAKGDAISDDDVFTDVGS